MDRFEDSRRRAMAALAAVEAAERECLRAAIHLVTVLAEQAGLGAGPLMIFHAVPRADVVWALDDQDCSHDDAELKALDLADTSGLRLRLTPEGLGPLLAGVGLEEPRGASFAPCDTCMPHGRCGVSTVPAGSGPSFRIPPRPPRTGDQLWQRAVLTWVDLHRALATWTGRRLAATLVVAPEYGDVASLDPFYCPDRGPDFEVVTSLRLDDAPSACVDLDAELATVLEEQDGVTPDLVEMDLRRWMDTVGFALPGFPAHGPGTCGPSGEGC